MAENFDRFRSFAERYIIARAVHFRVGFEREDAWAAILDAKTIYGSIAAQASVVEPDYQQAGSMGSPGVTGPIMHVAPSNQTQPWNAPVKGPSLDGVAINPSVVERVLATLRRKGNTP